MQFSIASLLAVAFAVAIVMTVARTEASLTVLTFPLILGPIAALQVTRSKSAFVIGILSSIFWTILSTIPLLLIGWFVYSTRLGPNENPMMLSLFDFITVGYFFAVSYLGGYIGGHVARPD